MRKIDKKINSPKRFGEILDLTFSLSKNKFKDFFMILFVFMGPLYLLQALIQLSSGVSFFREVTVTGGGSFENVLASFDESESLDLGVSTGIIIIGLIGFLLFPVASAAVLITVDKIRKNEDYSIRSVIKQAFSRYGAIIGSSILFSLLAFGLFVVPILIVTITTIVGSAIHPVIGIGLAIITFLALAFGAIYLLTRWSFYFGSVVLGEGSPGFSRSWNLTRKRTWILIGLYIIFTLIITVIGSTVQLSFGLFLGNSVLYSMIASIVTIFMTLIFSVGYAVIYLDLKVRHDADDLKSMIEDYNVVN